MNFGRFQVRINLLLDPQQLAASFQVGEARSQVPITHVRSRTSSFDPMVNRPVEKATTFREAQKSDWAVFLQLRREYSGVTANLESIPPNSTGTPPTERIKLYAGTRRWLGGASVRCLGEHKLS